MAHVDTSLPAQPTGAAAALAARHAANHPLKLYGGWFCPFVQRVWITLHEKAVEHQYVEINPYRKEPDFLAMNPRGLVPTLAVPVDDGAAGTLSRPLYESSVVCEYLEDAYPEPSLLPSAAEDNDNAYARARARLWIDHVSTRVIPAFYKFLQHTPDKPFSLDQARAQLHAHLRTFVEEMDPRGPWFLGEQFSLVDISLAPWAKRLWLLNHYKAGGLGIPRRADDDDDDGADPTWQRWNQWLDAVENRQSVRETWSDDESYLVAYKRYADDTTGSLVGQATRQGSRLP